VILSWKNYQNARIFMIFARKMPEILHDNCRKIFFLIFFEGGGSTCLPCPPSPTPMRYNSVQVPVSIARCKTCTYITHAVLHLKVKQKELATFEETCTNVKAIQPSLRPLVNSHTNRMLLFLPDSGLCLKSQ